MRQFAILCVSFLLIVAAPAKDRKPIGTVSPIAIFGPQASAVRVGTTRGMGSGTVIGRKGKNALILTNEHVVPNGYRKIYVITGGQRYDGAFVATYHDADLALITAEVPNAAVPIATKDLEKGQTVRHFGGATGPQKGKVIGQTDWVINGQVNPAIDSDIFSIVGDSGSGIFNDDDELVGVHYQRKGDPEKEDTIANYVRNDHVRAFTQPYLNGWTTATYAAK